MKIEGKNLIIGFICFLIVFMVTAQIKTIYRSESDIISIKNENELRDEITQWRDYYDAATARINELNAKISEYQASATKDDEATKLIKDELDRVKMLAGLVAVKGQGIIITLDDTKALEKIAIDAGYYDPNVYVIHDSDLAMVVNELRAAGAEAISINGQRITGNSEIRCIGPQVLINGIRMTAPFKISAIGDSKNLRASLTLRGGIIDSIKSANIDVSIEEQEEIIIPAYEKTLNYQYATEVEGGAK